MELILALAVIVLLTAFIINKFIKSIYFIPDASEKKHLLNIVLAGIFLKSMIVLIWYNVRGDNFDSTWVDTVEYDNTATFLAGQFENFSFYNRAFIQGAGAHPGYNYFLGLIYFLFGHHTWLASVFNIIASVSVSLLFYFVALRLFNKDVAKYTLILNVFFPNYIPFDFFILKDNIVVLLLSIATLAVIMATERKNWRYYYILLFIIPILYFFRGELTVVFLFSLALHFVVSGSEKGISKKKMVLAIAMLGLLLVAGQYLKPADRSALDRLLNFSLGEGAYGGNQIPDFLDGTSGLTDALLRIVTHPVGFTLHVAKSLYLMVLGPTYFYAQSGPALFYKYDRFVLWDNLTGLLKMFLAPMMVYGFYTVVRNHGRRCFTIWFFPLAWFCLLLLAQDFFRWLLPAIPFLLLFAAVGLYQFQKIKTFYLVYFISIINFIFFSITREESFLLGVLPLLVSLSIMGSLFNRCSYRTTKD
jgi:4-amino-4-deoxy-L-arabinose transferase-like glycosyltransferase